MEEKNFVISGMMGFVVGDALGVPVEFMSREELKNNPVLNMREYGTHSQPRGTWSDDTSMSIATIDSLCGGIDYKDFMEKFSVWMTNGVYTPYGKVFDIGTTTSRAVMNYARGIEPLACGEKTERSNGNGSLMRSLPLAFYLYGRNHKLSTNEENKIMKIVHEVSCLTHAHPRSQMACGFYTRLIASILKDEKKHSPFDVVKESITGTFQHYQQGIYPKTITNELRFYQRLNKIEEFSHLPEDKIHSTGYIVDTLEAVVWCFITTYNYKDCVLKAVNLGGDTDTIGALAGGLAGCYYGYEAIPKDWLNVIARRDWIEKFCYKMQEKIETQVINNRRGDYFLGENIEPATSIRTMIECFYHSSEEEYYDLCDLVQKKIDNYGTERFYQACIDYLSLQTLSQEDIIKFANAFYALGIQDRKFCNPYTLIALLYTKIELKTPQTIEEDTENLIWSISVSLVKSANLYQGYDTEYEPLEDKKVISEIQRIQE